MPYKRPKLPEESIAAIARWIELGAPYAGVLIDTVAVATAQALIRNYFQKIARTFGQFATL